MKALRKIKEGIDSFALNQIALPIIRRAGKDSNYIKHYKKERAILSEKRVEDCMDRLMDSQVCDILALLSTQGDSGFSIGFKRYLLENAISFELLSPLTFTDSEFGEPYDEKGTRQNNRLSAVFKNSSGIYDIDAFVHRTALEYNLDTKKLVDGNNLTWSGTVIFHDEKNGKWIPANRGYIDLANESFRAKNRVTIPVINVVDDKCDRGTFIMNISKVSVIPPEFFKDYTLMSQCGKHIDEDLEIIKEHEDEFIKILERLK